jgi:outer membrane protein assembly factor BamB
VLVGNAVIQLVDSDKQAYIAAFDRKTGELLWKTDRDNFRGWSTPVLIRAGGHDELVVNGHAAVCAYDPATGEELWRVKNKSGRGTPTVTLGGGLLYTSNGTRPYLTAIRPGGSGDVTASHVAWQVQRTGRDIPSPIVIGNHVLIVGLRGGILGCYDTKTGKQLWLERLGTNFSASPVAWNGLAFFLNESGETFVVRPGPKAEIVSRNRMGTAAEEIFRASISPLGGRLYIRSSRRLYCVAK